MHPHPQFLWRILTETTVRLGKREENSLTASNVAYSANALKEAIVSQNYRGA
jgi:hypothetical protein